jgi:hypothetical protein
VLHACTGCINTTTFTSLKQSPLWSPPKQKEPHAEPAYAVKGRHTCLGGQAGCMLTAYRVMHPPHTWQGGCLWRCVTAKSVTSHVCLSSLSS